MRKTGYYRIQYAHWGWVIAWYCEWSEKFYTRAKDKPIKESELYAIDETMIDENPPDKSTVTRYSSPGDDFRKLGIIIKQKPAVFKDETTKQELT